MSPTQRLHSLLHLAKPVLAPPGVPLPQGGKVAVIQPLPGIGDMVWHLPHVRAVAQAVGAPVTLVAKRGSAAEELFAAEPSLRVRLWLPRKARPADLWRLAALLREEKFDAAVLLHHSRSLAAAAALAGIPVRAGYGFGLQRLWLNRPPFLPAGALPLHPYDQATAWLAAAGLPAEAEPILLVPREAQAAVQARLGPGAVVLGIGSSEPAKQWGAERFAALLDLLHAAGHARAVLLGGTAETELAAEILRRAGPAGRVTAIGWPLAEVAALLAQSAFYVGNDTGAANIAAAVGARSYVLFGATPPFRHASRIVPVVPAGGVDRVAGMARIAPADVMAAIRADQSVPLLAG